MNGRPSLREKAARAAKAPLAELSLFKKIMGSPFGGRFIKDMEFRTEMLLYSGFAVNLLYCLLQVALGIFYRSLWAGALAVFHLLLATMRFQLLKHSGREKGGYDVLAEWQKYRFCGLTLLGMTPFFASMLILVVHKNSGGKYPGAVIYLMAVYTAVTVILAAVNFVKFRRYHRPIIAAAKIINFVKALVSLLSLETAILTRYDRADNPIFRQALLGTAGGGVCLFVLGIAVHMVIRGTRRLKNK